MRQSSKQLQLILQDRLGLGFLGFKVSGQGNVYVD